MDSTSCNTSPVKTWMPLETIRRGLVQSSTWNSKRVMSRMTLLHQSVMSAYRTSMVMQVSKSIHQHVQGLSLTVTMRMISWKLMSLTVFGTSAAIQRKLLTGRSNLQEQVSHRASLALRHESLETLRQYLMNRKTSILNGVQRSVSMIWKLESAMNSWPATRFGQVRLLILF